MFSQVFNEDIQYIISNSDNIWDKFKNKTILITGATGLVARVLAYTFLIANKQLKLNLEVYLVIRNENKANDLYAQWVKDNNLHFIRQDIRKKIKCEKRIDYIFHAAAITDSKSLISYPIEAFETQVLGTKNVLELASQDDSRVVYFSSMEIYGQPVINGMTHEEDLGYVDPLVIRSGYPEAKRACEFLGKAYSEEKNVFVVNARLAQTFGPGIQKNDHRVFAQFIRSAMKKESLVLHTDGSSLGNYCYLRDTIQALLVLSVHGKNGNSYNVVNEKTNISIKGLAKLVSNRFGNGKVIIDIPDEDMGYAPKVNLHLSSKKLKKLGWVPTCDLEEMFSRTISSFENVKKD